jgi:hypothetical protein
MFTVDRLNRLLKHYGSAPIDASELSSTGFLNDDNNFVVVNRFPCHSVLNSLDKLAGIATGRLHSYGKLEPTDYVGARIRAHEETLAMRRPPPLTDDSCICGCC